MFASILSSVNGVLYYPILIILLIAGGLYFSFRTRFVQLRYLKESINVVMEKPTEEGSISSFQALMVSTASRVGTGNIVGVSTAICLGGYGAVFWMWCLAVLGGASAFIESTLAQIYKKRDENGGSYGGPAYYIESALHSRPLAIIFSICLMSTFALGYNALASYNLQSTFAAYSFYNEAVTPAVIGLVLAVAVGICIMGGGKRVVKIASAIVPFMGISYVLIALLIIVMNIGYLPTVFANIFSDAFNFKAIFSGMAGSCMIYGIKRGLYSNEAGMGSAPNAAASADVSHPVKQGLVQMLSVFIDTLVLCTATAMMCLCSGIVPTAEAAGAPYVQQALSSVLGAFGPIFVTFAMVLFAFTTLLGNLFYVDNTLNFLNHGKTPGKNFMMIYRIICCIIIFAGAVMPMGTVWDLADVTMGFMALINIPTCAILGKVALGALADYEKQKNEGKDPVFKAASVGLENKVDFWH